jgi:NDP-sugar pyrophosphorylase family protein
MAVVPNTEPDRYGGAVVDPTGMITGFTRRGSAESSYHVIGLQVVEAEAFASLPDNTPCESTRSLYPALIRAIPGSVRAWRTSADFLDIGTPADYLATALSVAARQGLRQNPSGLRVRIDATAQVVDSVLWDDVAVEAGALLRECVITDGVRVPADTSWTGVTIRNANGELCDGERVIDGLAIGPI